MTEGKRGKVISLFDELAKRGKTPQEARKPAKTVRIDGNQSVGLIGNGNQVTIYVSTGNPDRLADERLRLAQGNTADEERAQLIKAIHANRRKRGLDEAALAQLVGTISMSRLAVADLRRILATILAVPPTTG